MFQFIKSEIYDYLIKNTHFKSKYPFDFSEKVNFSFDGFLLAIILI